MVACSNGMTSCVRLLLQDPRVNLSEPDEKGLTPIMVAVDKNRDDIIRWWIASEGNWISGNRELMPTVRCGKGGDLSRTIWNSLRRIQSKPGRK